jgi:hypothetical protein
MKKIRKVPRLNVKRETIRQLDPPIPLGAAVGGADLTTLCTRTAAGCNPQTTAC